MQSDNEARHGAPESSGKKKKKFNRKGQWHHQRTTDQSRKRRPIKRGASFGEASRPRSESFGGASNPRSSSGRKRVKDKSIDPSRFINSAVATHAGVTYVPKNTFDDFCFSKMVASNLRKKGYKLPMPIQDGAIKYVLEGRDLIGLANTGTGKTAAFVLPIVHRIETGSFKKRVLVLAPTRELAKQIEDEFTVFSAGLSIRSALLIGGVNMQRQRDALARKPQILIATPGRLLDFLQQRKLSLGDVSILVLDEMDRMLDMGFIKDIRKILGNLPEDKQTLCFSATITPDIKDLLEQLLSNPVTVSVVNRETAEHVEQDVVVAGNTKEDKIDTLIKLLREEHYTKVLVFGRTKWGVQKLAKKLAQAGISSEAIHGNKSQPQRQRALDAFKKGSVSTLVATDVAARGLDIDDVSHVINFDQPATYEDYIHRIGRTGRAGKKGHALTFISETEFKKINRTNQKTAAYTPRRHRRID